MAGRRSFAELRARLSPEARVRADNEAEQLLDEMELAEVRRALKLSQEELAQTLQVGQAAAKSAANRRTASEAATIKSGEREGRRRMTGFYRGSSAAGRDDRAGGKRRRRSPKRRARSERSTWPAGGATLVRRAGR